MWAEFEDIEPIPDEAMAVFRNEEPETEPEFGLPGIPDVDQEEGRTDLSNARRLVKLYGENMRFCHAWKKWLLWNGHQWSVDDSGAAQRTAKAVADHIWRDAIKSGNDDATQWAARTASKNGITAMLALAESELPIAVYEMDRNPWLLNCENGTLDLRTGRLREARREDYITKICPTEFNPEAICPTWEQFQPDVCDGNAELVAFKQRLYGYALTGIVKEQILPIGYGTGANGKSTEIDAVNETLGPDYCGTLPRSLLMVTQGERHPTELTTLHGKRLVIGHETDDGGRLSEALVKMLTGGDAITARGMRQDFWTFQPTHKILLLTNHRPRVKGTDHAIWRRLRLVPYTVRFEGDRRDKSMPDKLRRETSGILAWMVRGCLEWQRIGLSDPSVITEATEGYRADEDSLATFIQERCLVGAHYKAKASDLYGTFKEWAEDAGERVVMSQKAFGNAMNERDFERIVSNGTWYKNIAIKAE